MLQLLYSLQRITLRIVEAIQQWRSRLTRPYAFEWRGINYIFKIIKDCQFIDTCDLNAILPLQLSTYPLCSNLSSLSLFGPQSIGSQEPGQRQGIAITYPMKVNKKTMIPQVRGAGAPTGVAVPAALPAIGCGPILSACSACCFGAQSRHRAALIPRVFRVPSGARALPWPGPRLTLEWPTTKGGPPPPPEPK